MKLFSILLLLVAALANAQDNTLQQEVINHERQELDALKNADYKAFSDLIADDAVFRLPGGTWEVVLHSTEPLEELRWREGGTDYALVARSVVVLAAAGHALRF